MRKILVVANQTLGRTELMAEIERQIAEGECEFYVVVPMTPIDDYQEPVILAYHDSFDAQRNSQAQAHHRMTAVVAEIRELGARADGEVGDADPLAAIHDVTAHREFDEIILSTFPPGISKWLKIDLPSRVERTFDGPVNVITSAVRSGSAPRARRATR